MYNIEQFQYSLIMYVCNMIYKNEDFVWLNVFVIWNFAGRMFASPIWSSHLFVYAKKVEKRIRPYYMISIALYGLIDIPSYIWFINNHLKSRKLNKTTKIKFWPKEGKRIYLAIHYQLWGSIKILKSWS